MHIFVTGASGHIGSLLTAELLQAGHRVVGLARSDASAARIAALGGVPLRASLDEPERLAEAAADSDGVVHLAFVHDFGDFARAAATDHSVIDAIGTALAGTGKPFLAASGTMMLVGAIAPGEVGTEATDIVPASQNGNPRVASEAALLALAEHGIRSAALRFAPTVHGPTDAHGFIPTLIAAARRNGFAGYVDAGSNCWPAVHNLDVAHLIRLAIEDENLPAGIPLHAVAEEGIAFRTIAQAIGTGAGVPARSLTAEQAVQALAPIGAFAGLDDPASSAATRELLHWTPTHPGLLADLEAGFYFAR